MTDPTASRMENITTNAYIYLDSERRFLEVMGGDPQPAAEAYTDGLIVVRLASGEFRPLWMVPRALRPALPEAMVGNWAARAASCRTTAELVLLLEELTAEQFEAIVETLPIGLIHDLTGHPWHREKQDLIFEYSLRRYEEELVKKGVQLGVAPAQLGSPLSLDQLRLIDERPATEPGTLVPLEALSLPAALEKALRDQGGIEGLYSHQALALEFIRRSATDGADLILSTPTASGKTNAFLPGIIEQILQKRGTAILMYPLKALSQDQEGKIRTLLNGALGSSVSVASFTGDSKAEDLYAPDGSLPDLLIATPDKLNHHLTKPAIQAVLGQARFVVLDEAHSYRSFFGSNVALLLRRLTYQARSDCRFVLSSATLENTIEFARNLTGRKRFRVVGCSGGPRHARYFYLATSGSGMPVRRHTPVIRSLAHDLRRGNDSAIVFVQRRTDTHSLAGAIGRRDDGFVVPLYSGRKGYKQIVERLRLETDEAKLIISTTTLEAGVDIGNLSTAAMLGFPRNRNSFVQMAGRAGRSGAAHVVFLPGAGPADEYYGVTDNYTRLVNEAGADPVYINPANHHLLARHLARFRWEALKSKGEDGIALLDVLVPDGINPEAREQLMERLAPMFAEPPSSSQAPQLRGAIDVPYVILRTGLPGDPEPMKGFSLRLGSNDSVPDFLIERCNERNAYLEWALDHLALREDRYYRVIDWTTGHLCQEERSDPTIFIWVKDVSDDLVSAELYNQVRLGLVEPPQDREGLEHFNTSLMDVAARIDRVSEVSQADNLTVRTGPGDVTTTLSDTRRRFTPTATYVCPRWARSRGESLAMVDRSTTLVLEDRESGTEAAVTVKSFDQDSSFEQGRLFRSMGEGIVEATVAREVKREGATIRVKVDTHTFNGVTEGQCSCGKRTYLKRDWGLTFEPAPASWHGHEVFKQVVSRLETDLAQFFLTGDSPRSLAAVAYAITKALPDALKIDVNDVGFTASFHSSGLSLFFYDELEGGAAIALRIPHKLPEILKAALDLLEQSAASCSCNGTGCYGCVRPFRDLQLLEPATSDGEGLPTPVPLEAAHGARFLQNLLATELTSLQAAASCATPRDEDSAEVNSLVPTVEARADETQSEPENSTDVHDVTPSLWRPPVWDPTSRPYFSHLVVDIGSLDVTAASQVLRTTMRFENGLRHTLLTEPEGSDTRDLDLPQDQLKHATEVSYQGKRVDSLQHALARSEGLLGPTMIVTADPWKLVQFGRLGETFYTALPLWQSGAATLLGTGPDLILELPEHVPASMVQPNGFMHPLEQAGRKLQSRQPPPVLARAGLLIRVLGRYEQGSREGAGVLDNASQMLRAFQKHGQNTGVLARYLSERHPGRAIALIPSTPSVPVPGMALLAKALTRRGHRVIVTSSSDGDGSGTALRLAGLPPQPVLVITDLVSSGSSLASACEFLTNAGFHPDPMALAYQVERALESELIA